MHKRTPYRDRVGKIEEFFRCRGRMPSHSEMMTLFDVSPRAVTKIVNALVADGLIGKDETGRLIPCQWAGQMQEANLLPHVGRITAGLLREAVQECSEFVDVGGLLKTIPGDFLLTVGGDSMQNAGILDGDIVQIRPVSVVENKTIVAAQVVQGNGQYESTLKRIHFSPGRKTVTLQPENTDYEPLTVAARKVEIAGVYKGLIRPLV